jgi:hypothetical protein
VEAGAQEVERAAHGNRGIPHLLPTGSHAVAATFLNTDTPAELLSRPGLFKQLFDSFEPGGG